jgi:ribosome-associated protein
MTAQPTKILNAIAQSLFDKKGFNILVLDVRGISTMTDYFVIAEGNVDRHVKALSQTLEETLDSLDWRPYHIEGGSTADWIVMDYSDIVIHLMIPELRERYNLEELWKEGKVVDVQIKVDALDNKNRD